jgi:Protein of unknown function (DUF2934)
MEDREYRIRDRAYLIWVQEGCPDGAAERHWLMAEEIVNEEDTGVGALLTAQETGAIGVKAPEPGPL